MAKGKRVEPTHQIEYRLLLAQEYDEKLKQIVTRAVLRTATEFTSFKYQLVVDTVVNGTQIRFNIQGLRAPHLSMPETGPALYTADLPNLRGTYDVVVTKLGKDVNTFVIVIDEHSIELKESPKKRFCELVTDRSAW